MRIHVAGESYVADRLRELVSQTHPFRLSDSWPAFTLEIYEHERERLQVDSADGPFEQVLFRELRAAVRRNPKLAGIGVVELQAEGGNLDPRCMVVGVPAAWSRGAQDYVANALWIALCTAAQHGQRRSWWARLFGAIAVVVAFSSAAAAQTSRVTQGAQGASTSPWFVTCVNPSTGLTESCAGAGGGGSVPTDTDDGSVAGGQTAGINLSLLKLWNGSAWVRAPGDATSGLKVNCVSGCAAGSLTLESLTTLQNAATAAGNGTSLDVTGYTSVFVVIDESAGSSSARASVIFEGSHDGGTTWQPIDGTSVSTGIRGSGWTVLTSDYPRAGGTGTGYTYPFTSLIGFFTADVRGLDHFRARLGSATAPYGTWTVKARPMQSAERAPSVMPVIQPAGENFTVQFSGTQPITGFVQPNFGDLADGQPLDQLNATAISTPNGPLIFSIPAGLTGTVTFEMSPDGATNWTTEGAWLSDGAYATSVSSFPVWGTLPDGVYHRLRVSAYTSGSASPYLFAIAQGHLPTGMTVRFASAQDVNIKLNGTTPTAGPGATDGATIRVRPASDSTISANQGTATATIGNGWLIANGNFSQQTATWTSATSLNSTLSAGTINNGASLIVTVRTTTTITAGALTFEASDDGSNFFTVQCARTDTGAGESTYTLVASTSQAWHCYTSAWARFRIRLSTAITGTGSATLLTTPNAAAGASLVTVQQATAANLQATATLNQTGTANDVDVVSLVPGTGATNLGKAEDAAAASGDTGLATLGVRNDGGSTQATSANGDYGNFAMDAYGVQYTRVDSPNRITCGADNIAATLTQLTGCGAPGASVSIYITDVVAQSTTTTGGTWILRQGTGTNCGTGTASVLPSAATVARLSAPANTAAANVISLGTPIKLTANNALCVLGVATNTTTIQVTGYIAP